jgi:hypothetical protein
LTRPLGQITYCVIDLNSLGSNRYVHSATPNIWNTNNVPSAQVLTLRRAATPPYVGFDAVKSLLIVFASHGVPDLIDQDAIPRSSPVQASQILTGLKFLGLADERNAPTGAMHDLVKAVGTESWPERFGGVLRAAYGALFEIDLASLGHREFMDWFSQKYPGAEDVQRKSRAFFLRAAHDARIPIHHDVMRLIRPRTPTVRNSLGGVESFSDDDPSYRTSYSGRPRAQRKPPRLSALLTGAFPDFAKLGRSDREAVNTTISLLMERGR